MSYRTTIVLVIVLALVIGISIVYTTSRGSSTPDFVRIPENWFYQVDDDDIQMVAIQHQGQAALFVTDSESIWHFDTATGEPVDLQCWSGVPFLLSGPQYTRIIAEQATDLARYGLDPPRTVVTVGLSGIGDVQVKLGDKTPDGTRHYAQFQSSPTVFLVDSGWGDVIIKQVIYPPRILPTPRPEGSGCPAPTTGVPATAEPSTPGPTPEVTSVKTYSSPPALLIDVSRKYFATIETEKGTIRAELFAPDAPNTVNNFVFLAREGFYDGTIFHRVIANFMAQGGDPDGDGTGGPGYSFGDEFSDRKHITGALSMANSGPNTNGSQFFIVYAPQPHLDGVHSVFGQVVEGMDVALRLTSGDRMIRVTIEEA